MAGRMAVLVAGWPETVSGTTVDRQCGSSMQTNFNAAAAVWSGQLDVVVSAGVEMMSRVPMGSNGGDLSDRLHERWQIVPQGISAEVIAEEWGITRAELDEYSLESHRRAIAAIDAGKFEREIVPVEVAGDLQPAGAAIATTTFAVDETPRRDTSAEKLAALEPAFLPEGRVTAGRLSSQTATGTAAVLIASESAVRRLGLEPRARFVSFGLSGVDPHRMLHGNPEACANALERAGLTWGDIAVVEVNEAFASVPDSVHARHRAGRSVGPTSTRTAAGSRWAIRSARPAPGHRDAAERAGPPRRALRDRVHVHRLRHGDRRRRRASLTRWLLVRGRGDAPLDARIDAEKIRAHSSSKRPSVERGGLRDPLRRGLAGDLHHSRGRGRS